MRLLADLHISPSTVAFLRTRGHDVVRVDAILPNTAGDEEIVVAAGAAGRSILTQDLDFSAIIALSGARAPSLVTLRLGSSLVQRVNEEHLGPSRPLGAPGPLIAWAARRLLRWGFFARRVVLDHQFLGRDRRPLSVESREAASSSVARAA